MNRYFQWLPNAFTLFNLLLGCMSIHFASVGNVADATYYIYLAIVFDFMDGFAARLFSATSPLGKELDSLADVVSFGVAPSFLMFELASHADFSAWIWGNPEWVSYSAFSIALASGWRLARFNIDSNSSQHFVGMPTPANALLITGWVWISATPSNFLYNALQSPYVLLVFIIVSVLLPISTIYFMSFKFDKSNKRSFYSAIILIVTSILSLLLIGISVIPFIVLLYILLSIIEKKNIGKVNI